jgi:hypothetical protein
LSSSGLGVDSFLELSAIDVPESSTPRVILLSGEQHSAQSDREDCVE